MGPLGQPVYTFTYNSNGQVLITTDPTSLVVSNTYTSGNLTSSALNPAGLNAVTSYAYDSVGNATSITDPNGHTAEMLYNSNRQRTDVKNHDGGLGAVLLAWSQTVYDAVGRVTDEKAAKCFTSANPCLASGTAVATWITARHVVYSATGKPISVTDADSQVTTTAYDDLDRVLTMTDPILQGALRILHAGERELRGAGAAGGEARLGFAHREPLCDIHLHAQRQAGERGRRRGPRHELRL